MRSQSPFAGLGVLNEASPNVDDEAMLGYLSTMNAFLKTQNDVMTAYFQSLGAASATEDVVSFLEKKTPFVPAGGLSFVDARDAAQAMILAMERGRAGERYLVDHDCNFCDCNADGTTTCTARTCRVLDAPCTYDNVVHAYGEHFPSTDGCNECACAVSGLACTRRACRWTSW